MKNLRALGEIAELRTGLQASRLKKESSKHEANSKGHDCAVRLLSLSSISGTPREVDLSALPDHVWVSGATKERFAVTGGDILVQPKGGDYWAIKPRVAQVAHTDFVFSYQFIRVRSLEGVLAGYLLWYLNHRETVGLLATLEQGTTVPFLSKRNLEGLLVPIPSVQVQEAVVELSQAREEEEGLLRSQIEWRRALVEDECLGQVLKASDVKLEELNG